MTLRDHADALGEFLGQRHLGDRYDAGALAQVFLSSRAKVIADLIAGGRPVPPSAWTTHFVGLSRADTNVQASFVACDYLHTAKNIPVAVASAGARPMVHVSLLSGVNVAYVDEAEYQYRRSHPTYRGRSVLIRGTGHDYLTGACHPYAKLKCYGVFEDPTEWVGLDLRDDGSTCGSVLDVEVGFVGETATRAYEYILRLARQGMITPIDNSSDDNAEA